MASLTDNPFLEGTAVGTNELLRICQCLCCGNHFESHRFEILCGCCKQAALLLHEAAQKMPSGNLPPMSDRVKRGNTRNDSGIDHMVVRPKFLGED